MKKILFNAGDGPDGVTAFIDTERAIVDHADPDSLYVSISVMGATAIFGPMLKGVTHKLLESIDRKEKT